MRTLKEPQEEVSKSKDDKNVETYLSALKKLEPFHTSDSIYYYSKANKTVKHYVYFVISSKYSSKTFYS
jgi:hypothetical protein